MIAESTFAGISEVREWLLCTLKSNDFPEADIFAVHLALEEAFYNAVQHGNKMNPDKKVKIDCFVSSDKVDICMADDGKGFDPDSVPDCRNGENIYKPTGRGLLLMRSYMDKVIFNELGNMVRMIRYKNSPKGIGSLKEKAKS